MIEYLRYQNLFTAQIGFVAEFVQQVSIEVIRHPALVHVLAASWIRITHPGTIVGLGMGVEDWLSN